MTEIIGLDLERALALVKQDMGLVPDVEQAAPPRGVPERAGIWRVVRADLSRGRITAAFFPLLESGTPEADEN